MRKRRMLTLTMTWPRRSALRLSSRKTVVHLVVRPALVVTRARRPAVSPPFRWLLSSSGPFDLSCSNGAYCWVSCCCSSDRSRGALLDRADRSFCRTLSTDSDSASSSGSDSDAEEPQNVEVTSKESPAAEPEAPKSAQ